MIETLKSATRYGLSPTSKSVTMFSVNKTYHRCVLSNIESLSLIPHPYIFIFSQNCPLVLYSISRKVSIVSPLVEQRPFVLSQYRNILNFIIFNSFSKSEILIFQVVVFVQKSLKNHLFRDSQ